MSRETRRAIPRHLMEKAWEMNRAFTAGNGAPPLDKLAWLNGFAACIGVITGSLDVNIPTGTPTLEVLSQLVNVEIPKYQAELMHLEEQARKRNN